MAVLSQYSRFLEGKKSDCENLRTTVGLRLDGLNAEELSVRSLGGKLAVGGGDGGGKSHCKGCETAGGADGPGEEGTALGSVSILRRVGTPLSCGGNGPSVGPV